jgi:hypothetical protein
MRYLEICYANSSLHGMTWLQFHWQLDHLELRKTFVLNPDAPEFVPNRLRHATLTEPAALTDRQPPRTERRGGGRAGAIGHGVCSVGSGASVLAGEASGSGGGFYGPAPWFAAAPSTAALHSLPTFHLQQQVALNREFSAHFKVCNFGILISVCHLANGCV